MFTAELPTFCGICRIHRSFLDPLLSTNLLNPKKTANRPNREYPPYYCQQTIRKSLNWACFPPRLTLCHRTCSIKLCVFLRQIASPQPIRGQFQGSIQPPTTRPVEQKRPFSLVPFHSKSCGPPQNLSCLAARFRSTRPRRDSLRSPPFSREF